MSGEYTGWFDGWQNARQRRAIEGLEGEIGALSSSLSRQRHEAARLRSQISQLRGTLEQRVNRLAQSLQALVELSDVRQVLAIYDPPAVVRYRARDVLTALEVGEFSAADRPTEDVPGYWLAPAVQALAALVRGHDPEPALATARQRDRTRTALLLSAGLAVVGRPELATEAWLAEALGPLSAGSQVTVAQRALWIAMARGGYGETGGAVLRRRLAELVDNLPRDQEQEQAKAWSERVAALPAGGTTRSKTDLADQAARRSLEAGRRLAALRQLCCPRPPTPGRTVAAGQLDPADREQLTEALHGLVDEGTPEEAPLLRRAAELRAAIQDGPDANPPSTWDSAAGEVYELLRQDAFDAGRPWLAEPAQRVGHRWLLAAATELSEAARSDQPAAVTVRVGHAEIRVGPSGPDSWELARVRTEIQERPLLDPRADRITLWLAIVGAGLLVAVFGWPNPLAVLSVLAGLGLLLTAGVRWLKERHAREARRVQRDADLQRTDRLVEQTAAELAELQRQLTEATHRAATDLEAIRGRLRA